MAYPQVRSSCDDMCSDGPADDDIFTTACRLQVQAGIAVTGRVSV